MRDDPGVGGEASGGKVFGDAVDPARQVADQRHQPDRLVRDLLLGAGGGDIADHGAGLVAGGVDQIQRRIDLLQGALQRTQRAERQRNIARHTHAFVQHQPQQLGEEGHRGAGRTRPHLRDDAAELALQIALIDLPVVIEQFQHGVGGQRGIIGVHRPQQQTQAAASRGVQASHRAVVEQADGAVGPDQHIAGMQIGMKDALAEDLPQHGFEQHRRGFLTDRLRNGRDQFARPRDGNAVETFHDDHSLVAQLVVDRRHPHPTGHQFGTQRIHIADLDGEIELIAHRVGKTAHDVVDAEPAGPFGVADQPAGQASEYLQIDLDLLGGACALHLGDHLIFAVQSCGMHLGQ